MAIAHLLLVAGGLRLSAQESDRAVRFSGEARLRGEWDGRSAGVDADAATLSRIRFGAQAAVQPGIRAFLQIQDARGWGTESNTLSDANADQLDLHQGYVDLDVAGVMTRLGRQELKLGDERLVGAVDWSNTGRSFDGVLASRTSDVNEWRLFWMNVGERDSLLAIGTNPQGNEGSDGDGWFLGAWFERVVGRATLELSLLHDRNALTDASWTTMARAHGRAARVLFDGGAAYQFGPDRRAFLITAMVGAALGEGSAAAQIDWLSGDADPTDATRRAFHTLYATNHKFYGYMDYFLSLPAQTQEGGLIDAMARFVIPLPRAFRVRADGHYFQLVEARGGERFLGFEGDAVLSRVLAPRAAVELGGGVYVPGDAAPVALPAFASDGDRVTYWGYAQLVVRFP